MIGVPVKHRRIVITHYGGPEELRIVEEDRPDPKAGEVRVKVLATGVSLPDLMMREGIHPETPRLPFTPGWDLVGVVDRLGDGVSGIEPGRIVAALPIHGAYAEYVCLPQRELVPVPAGLDPAEAVSLILNYVTAYQMLHRSAKVRPGQRVFETAVEGMEIGEARQAVVSPMEGYGERNPDALQEVPKDKLPSDITVGTQLHGKDAEGRTVRPIVSAIREDRVVLDFNHPLAGKTLYFDLKVVNIN